MSYKRPDTRDVACVPSTQISVMSLNPTSELSAEALFDILSAPHRRALLHSLRKEEGITLTELVDSLIETEHGTVTKDLIDDIRARVMAGLLHVHLPKLIDAGLINYYREQDMITLGQNAPPALEHLALLNEQGL